MRIDRCTHDPRSANLERSLIAPGDPRDAGLGEVRDLGARSRHQSNAHGCRIDQLRPSRNELRRGGAMDGSAPAPGRGYRRNDAVWREAIGGDAQLVLAWRCGRTNGFRNSVRCTHHPGRDLRWKRSRGMLRDDHLGTVGSGDVHMRAGWRLRGSRRLGSGRRSVCRRRSAARPTDLRNVSEVPRKKKYSVDVSRPGLGLSPLTTSHSKNGFRELPIVVLVRSHRLNDPQNNAFPHRPSGLNFTRSCRSVHLRADT